jgi:hypothetical protein
VKFCPKCGSPNKKVFGVECRRIFHEWHSTPAIPEQEGEAINLDDPETWRGIGEIPTGEESAEWEQNKADAEALAPEIRVPPLRNEPVGVKLPIDECVRTIVDDCLSRKDSEWMANRARARIQALLNLQRSGLQAELKRMREALELSTTRLKICLGRMVACQDAWLNEHELSGHGVSLQEIPAWIDEQKAAIRSAFEKGE